MSESSTMISPWCRESESESESGSSMGWVWDESGMSLGRVWISFGAQSSCCQSAWHASGACWAGLSMFVHCWKMEDEMGRAYVGWGVERGLLLFVHRMHESRWVLFRHTCIVHTQNADTHTHEAWMHLSYVNCPMRCYLAVSSICHGVDRVWRGWMHWTTRQDETRQDHPAQKRLSHALLWRWVCAHSTVWIITVYVHETTHDMLLFV